MSNIQFPNYLLPLDAITYQVQITGEVKEKTDQNGNQKYANWNAQPGWVVPIEIIRGTLTKVLPDGTKAEALDLMRLNVTVWSATKPNAPLGSYVTLTGLAVGAVDGNIFVQATGVQPSESNVDELFGGAA